MEIMEIGKIRAVKEIRAIKALCTIEAIRTINEYIYIYKFSQYQCKEGNQGNHHQGGNSCRICTVRHPGTMFFWILSLSLKVRLKA